MEAKEQPRHRDRLKGHRALNFQHRRIALDGFLQVGVVELMLALFAVVAWAWDGSFDFEARKTRVRVMAIGAGRLFYIN